MSPFDLIEPKWQHVWDEQQTFRAWNPGEQVPATHPFAQRHGKSKPETVPKYYILDMFPLPFWRRPANARPGIPRSYTAYRYSLSPLQTRTGSACVASNGLGRFWPPGRTIRHQNRAAPAQDDRNQYRYFQNVKLSRWGFSYDWSREIDTTDPEYFRWTQSIFLKLYNSWFNPKIVNKAESIDQPHLSRPI